MTLTTRSPLLLPAGARSGLVLPGHIDILSDQKLMQQLGIQIGFGGGVQGFNTEGDVITQTIDGVDLNGIWAEFQKTVSMRNAARQSLIDFLTYTVTNPIDTVPQFGSGTDFEVASEFGVPKGANTSASYFQMGFAFEWYDVAGRYTWKYLAEATAQQVESVHQSILEADNRNVFRETMATMFDSTNRVADIRNQSYNVYALYNNDGTVPPAYKTNTFLSTHSHYLSSGAATVDSGDLDEMQTHIEHHGYLPSSGVELVVMVNKAQGDVIRQFRSIANGGVAMYDFIPAIGTPSLLMPLNKIQGDTPRPSASLRGLKVIGSYGDLVVVQEDYIPAGYMVAFGTGGAESLSNPVGIREHANPALRGLRLVKGRSSDYPLQDSYYQRGFGTGIRQRGAAVVMRIGVAAYSAPAEYAR